MEEPPKARVIFAAGSPYADAPERILTLGHFYPREARGKAQTRLQETRPAYGAEPPENRFVMHQNLGWTRLITALNAGRQWPLNRLFDLLDPLLEPGIALTVVPTHDSYRAFTPMQKLAKELAENGRVDAVSCLIRHTTIRKITYGGESTRELHRETIRVENRLRIEGRAVLLLDDIVKSGTSLRACQELLLEAGAQTVQAMALGQVIAGEEPR